MSVAPTTTETVYQLIGSNLGPFATVWSYAVHTDVLVYLDQGAGPVLLDEGPDYTLSPTLPTLTNGGDVLLDASLLPADGWPTNLQPGGEADVNNPTVILKRDTPDGQPAVFGEMGGFSPEAWEAALDNVERQGQEHATDIARAILFAPGEAGWQVPDEIVRENTIVGFDDLGRPTLYPATVTDVHVTFFDLPFEFLGGTPAVANELMARFVAVRPMTIPADFNGGANGQAHGAVRVHPTTANVVVTVKKNGNAVGTMTVAQTTGVFTFASGGLAITLAAGDVLDFFAPPVPDASACDYGWTIVGSL